MTKKQNLHYETIRIQNEIRNLQGKSEMNINLDEYSQTGNFAHYCDKRTTAELEKELAIAEQALKDAQKKAKRDAWLLSEEGLAFTAKNEEERRLVRNQILALRNETYRWLRGFVKELLGQDFDVTSFGWSSFEVGLVKEYRENGMAVAEFGHEMTIYWGHEMMFNKEFNFELNYGCLGSFELGKDEKRVKYLCAMATFSSSERVTVELRRELEKVTEIYEALKSEQYRLEREMKNAGK